MTLTAPDICVIALDETEFWTIPPAWRPLIVRIEGIYAFDRHLGIHVASTTASYELWAWENRALLTDAANRNDALREEIDEWIQRNADNSEPVTYMNCYSVDALIQSLATQPYRFRSFGDGIAARIVDAELYRELGLYESWDSNARARFMDKVISEFNANSPI